MLEGRNQRSASVRATESSEAPVELLKLSRADFESGFMKMGPQQQGGSEPPLRRRPSAAAALARRVVSSSSPHLPSQTEEVGRQGSHTSARTCHCISASARALFSMVHVARVHCVCYTTRAQVGRFNEEEMRQKLLGFARLVCRKQLRDLARGDALFEAGDPADRFYIVAKGALAVRTPRGQRLSSHPQCPLCSDYTLTTRCIGVCALVL